MCEKWNKKVYIYIYIYKLQQCPYLPYVFYFIYFFGVNIICKDTAQLLNSFFVVVVVVNHSTLTTSSDFSHKAL